MTADAFHGSEKGLRTAQSDCEAIDIGPHGDASALGIHGSIPGSPALAAPTAWSATRALMSQRRDDEEGDEDG